MSKYVEASECLLSKHICTLCYVSFGPNETCKNSLTFFNFLLFELNIPDSKSRIGISVWSEDIVAKLSFVFVNNDLTLEWCQRDCKTQQKKISNQQQNWEQQLAFANFSRSYLHTSFGLISSVINAGMETQHKELYWVKETYPL